MPETQPNMNSDIRPVPDPTSLTTEANVRLEAAMRTLVRTEIAHQNDLFDEKVHVIMNTLNMIDARTAEQKSDMKAALDAALAAQKESSAGQTASLKESITKTEVATIERIKAGENLLSSFAKAIDDKIADIKDRVIAIEAVKLGNVEHAATSRASSGDMRGNMASIISIITVVLAMISVTVAIFIATKH